MNEETKAEPTPEGDREIRLDDKVAAAETISGAKAGEPAGSAWAGPPPPRVSDAGPISRVGDTGSRLAFWSPEMDRRTMDDPRAPSPIREVRDDTLIQETDIQQSPFAPRMATTGRSQVPRPMVSQHREQCPHCEGTGFMPGISDYLRESIALVGDQGDEVVRAFYGTLFRAAPELVKLFPGDPTKGDLGTDHKGARQRELLLSALVALSDLYDPDDGDKMARLDTALGSFGRKHAAFVRPDGTIKGATWEEYGAVKDALFQTLVRFAEEKWKPEYTEAWSQAYDYAAAVMLAEQHRSGFSAPRFPRV